MFASLFRASTDDRSPWGNFWFEPTSMRTSTGMRVTPDTAMRLSTVYACVRVLSESFAILPFTMYRPKMDGRGRTKIKNHWLVKLFTKRPNRYQNPFEWREMLQGHLALRGNAYCEIVEDGAGGIAELLPLNPARMKAETLATGNYRWQYSAPDGTTQYFTRDQVWHISGLSSDGVTGLNPIEIQREALGAALSAQEYGNRFFANDAKPTGGWVEVPGNINDKATRDKLKESVQDAVSGVNRHKTMILDRGMKYHEVGMANKDSQFLELRGFSRTEIAAMFRVPPHMIGDLSRATFSNIEQQSIDFWMGSMLPWTERWEAAIEWLLPEDDDLECEFDFRNLLRGDSTSRASYIHNMVLDGVLTRNEGRELEGYDPMDGLDEPLVPVNERGLNDPNPAVQPVQTPAKPADPQEPADDASARLVALLGGNAARMARRIGEGKAPSAEILAESLAVGRDAAVGWLELHSRHAGALTEDEITASLLALGSKT